MSWMSLPTRNLDRSELLRLVDVIAERPELWDGHVAFPDEQRHFVSLYRDDHVDVWLLCWTPVSDTGFHDHDLSSGAVRVLEGALMESTPRIGGWLPGRSGSAQIAFRSSRRYRQRSLPRSPGLRGR